MERTWPARLGAGAGRCRSPQRGWGIWWMPLSTSTGRRRVVLHVADLVIGDRAGRQPAVVGRLRLLLLGGLEPELEQRLFHTIGVIGGSSHSIVTWLHGRLRPVMAQPSHARRLLRSSAATRSGGWQVDEAGTVSGGVAGEDVGAAGRRWR